MSGVGVAFAQTIILLALFSGALYALLRWSGRGQNFRLHGRIVEVLDRASLDDRSTVHVIKIGDRVWLLVITTGDVKVIAELDPAELPPPTASPPSALEALLGRLSRQPKDP